MLEWIPGQWYSRFIATYAAGSLPSLAQTIVCPSVRSSSPVSTASSQTTTAQRICESAGALAGRG